MSDIPVTALPDNRRMLVGTNSLLNGPKTCMTSSTTPRTPTPADQQGLLDMLIVHTRALLEAQLQDGDELILKALGVLALDASALALLIALREDLSSYWLLPALGFGIASGFLLATVMPQEFDTGPAPKDFYDRFGGETHLVASRHMFVELVNAMEKNNDPLERKSRLFKLGFGVFVVALASAVVVALAS
jgi:hypothetical protein